MNSQQEFEKYAIKHRGISSNTLYNYQQHQVNNLTPNIIEETSDEHCGDGCL
jgi:ATP-dependent Clp protease protease subunit